MVKQVKPLTAAQIKAAIQKSNKQFDEADDKLRRVMIAQDAIAILKAEIAVAQQGRIFDYKCSDNTEFFEEDTNKFIDESIEDKSLRDSLYEADVPLCNVCAKGAIAISVIARVNDCTMKQAQDEEELSKKQLQYFDQEQLNVMEWAFEGWEVLKYPGDILDRFPFVEDVEYDRELMGFFVGGRIKLLAHEDMLQVRYNITHSDGEEDDDYANTSMDLCYFVAKYADPKQRLIAIFENVIENEGQFVWPTTADGKPKATMDALYELQEAHEAS